MTKKRIILHLVTALFLLLGFSIHAQNEVLLKTDENGKITEGSVENLIQEIRQGARIRVGWQLGRKVDGQYDLEHWADAGFISILKGHVFAQLEAIYQQSPKRDIPQINLVPSQSKWSAVIGTNGVLMSRMIIPDLNLIEDPILFERMSKQAEIKQKKAPTIWAKASN